MHKRLMTYEIAWAIATDKANAQMRANSRTAWSKEDYNLACATIDKLWFSRQEG